MNRLLLFLLLPLFVTVGALTGATPTKAASVYDNVIDVTQTLEMYNPTLSCSENHITNMELYWTKFFDDTPINGSGESTVEFNGTTYLLAPSVGGSYLNLQDTRDSFHSAESWAVVQNMSYDGSKIRVEITWTTLPSSLTFYNNDRLQALGTNIFQSIITLEPYGSGCGIRMETRHWNTTSGFGALVQYSPGRQMLLAYWDIIYPSDYEGQIPPDSVFIPNYSDYTPQFYVSVATKWKASIHDTNFNTFDGNPFLCGDGTAPIMYYEIWDKNQDPENLLTSGVQSATVQIDYQFPQTPQLQEYRIVGWYECPDASLTFTESSYFDFKINSTGQLYTVGMETCLQEDFPFFNTESCLVGMNSTLSLLAFNGFNIFPQEVQTVAEESNPNNCHSLGILGDWINKPGQLVCPAIPQEIRNTITPFATIIIAGTIFFYISRGRGVTIS